VAASPPAASRVTRTFLALASGEASARFVAFAGTVYLARTLGPEAYGAVGVALAVLLYIGRLADGGLELGVGVREAAKPRDHVAPLVSAVLTVRALIATLVAAVTAFVAMIALPPLEGRLVALYAITLATTGLSTRWVHIGLGYPTRVAGARLLGELIALGFLVVAVRHPEHVLRVPFAQLIADALVIVALLALLGRSGLKIRPRLDLALAGPVLRSGWRLMLASLVGLAIYNADLLFLRALRGREIVGYYTAAYLFVTFFLSIAIAYGLSLMGTLRSVWHDASRRQALFDVALSHVVLVGLPAVVGAAYVAPQIIGLLLGSEYAPAATALRILIWSALPAALCEVATVSIIAAGREGDVLKVYALTLAVSMVLNVALIPRFGMAGAAVATVIGEAARLAFALRAATRSGLTISGIARWWRLGVATSLMAVLLLSVRPTTLPLAIALGIAAYAIGLVATGVMRFRRSELPMVSV
jgi:O-antigen/teichoic acid export membrane protein